jgi:hypothetical protein
MASANAPTTRLDTIDRHKAGIYPAMAMLAGMQLALFTALRDGPLTAAEVAAAIDVKLAKLRPLLNALVAADLLNLQNGRFSNTVEADTYLVQERPSYMAGSRRQFYADVWAGLLKTAASIRTGAPQHKHNFYAMSEEEMAAFFAVSTSTLSPQGSNWPGFMTCHASNACWTLEQVPVALQSVLSEAVPD